MKIIDQTPLLDANGKLSLVNRIQGMLKYGFSWPANLEAQEKVIAQLNKGIEKNHTLFRNQRLGASEIVVPLILIGSSGIFALEATPLKGFYRARGDEWGTVSNGKFQPASINILSRTARLAKILQVFFERQGLKLSVEPVLLAADPGMHIESVRPAVRVVMSDAIDRFAASLVAGRPVYNPTEISELVERLQRPRSSRQEDQAPSVDDALAVRDERPFMESEPSRMQSILNSPRSDALIEKGGAQTFQQEPSELDFALEEETSPTVLVRNPYTPEEEETPQPKAAAPKPRRFFGMLSWQVAVLVFVFICWCAALAAVSVFWLIPTIQAQP
ncbi:MAG: hypothetical protein HY867_01190 [Chloroflexi bacterium]|nr:hypothetical protein [Chloroflexota bacterium]